LTSPPSPPRNTQPPHFRLAFPGPTTFPFRCFQVPQHRQVSLFANVILVPFASGFFPLANHLRIFGSSAYFFFPWFPPPISFYSFPSSIFYMRTDPASDSIRFVSSACGQGLLRKSTCFYSPCRTVLFPTRLSTPSSTANGHLFCCPVGYTLQLSLPRVWRVDVPFFSDLLFSPHSKKRLHRSVLGTSAVWEV